MSITNVFFLQAKNYKHEWDPFVLSAKEENKRHPYLLNKS